MRRPPTGLKNQCQNEAPHPAAATPAAATAKTTTRTRQKKGGGGVFFLGGHAGRRRWLTCTFVCALAAARMRSRFEAESSVQLQRFLSDSVAEKLVAMCGSADDADNLYGSGRWRRPAHPPFFYLTA